MPGFCCPSLLYQITSKMKALVFEKPGLLKEVLKLAEEVPFPVIKPTQVLVAVKASPVNPADHLFTQGKYRRRPIYPQIAGLEGSGIIVGCGKSVIHFKAGDHVAFRGVGTWAEQVAIEEQELIKIDRELPFEISCQIALNGITAQGLLTEAGLKAGDFLLLNAASASLSGLILQLAAAKGIRTIALVKNLKNEQELRALGVENVLLQEDPAFGRQATGSYRRPKDAVFYGCGWGCGTDNSNSFNGAIRDSPVIWQSEC